MPESPSVNPTSTNQKREGPMADYVDSTFESLNPKRTNQKKKNPVADFLNSPLKWDENVGETRTRGFKKPLVKYLERPENPELKNPEPINWHPKPEHETVTDWPEECANGDGPKFDGSFWNTVGNIGLVEAWIDVFVLLGPACTEQKNIQCKIADFFVKTSKVKEGKEIWANVLNNPSACPKVLPKCLEKCPANAIKVEVRKTLMPKKMVWPSLCGKAPHINNVMWAHAAGLSPEAGKAFVMTEIRETVDELKPKGCEDRNDAKCYIKKLLLTFAVEDTDKKLLFEILIKLMFMV